MKYTRHILFAEAELDAWLPYFRLIFPDGEWAVQTASTVASAKELFEGFPFFDAVALDYRFPDGTGTELLSFIREIDVNVPVFLISKRTDSDNFSAFDVREYDTLPYFIDKNVLEHREESVRQIRNEVRAEYEKYMMQMCTPRNFAEYDTLRTVLVHTPSSEVERIDPDNLHWYLFESRPDMDLMREQHRGFLTAIKSTGKRPLTLDVGLLLRDVMRIMPETERRTVVENILFGYDVNRLARLFRDRGMKFSPAIEEYIDGLCTADSGRIAETLLCGIGIADVGAGDAGTYTDMHSQIVFPVPNIYFMRDPSFTVGEHIVVSRMYWPMRRRESAILRAIFEYHPFMKNARMHMIDRELGAGDQLFSIEGGDVMNLGGGDFVIAHSERTDRSAIQALARILLERRGVERIYQPVIPAKRAFIHLDTVCSLVGPDHVVVHPSAIEAYADTLVWTRDSIRRGGEPESLDRSFIDVLKEDFGKEVIQTAGGGPRARLEQFDDATNVFMVDRETAIVYNRNRETNRIMREAGIKTEEFMGSDLVMGRGGARCMTMPLRRD